MTPLENLIYARLDSAFHPLELKIINNSHKHKHHSPQSVAAESHFRIYVKSDHLSLMPRVLAHRKIYEQLSDLITPGKIHALEIFIT